MPILFETRMLNLFYEFVALILNKLCVSGMICKYSKTFFLIYLLTTFAGKSHSDLFIFYIADFYVFSFMTSGNCHV